MAASFSNIVEYFRNLAINHVDIGHTDSEKHFYRFDIDEILAGISGKVNYPALILEDYEFKYKDPNSDNLQKQRTIAFDVVKHISDIGDHDLIHDTWAECEAIIDDFIKRMKLDKQLRNKVVRNIDINSSECQLIRNDIDQDYGIRCVLPIDSAMSGDVDNAKWKDL